jgi:hypothetical protein
MCVFLTVIDKENCVVLSVWLPSKYMWKTYEINNIKFNISTAAEILIVVFWVMTLYILLQGYQHFSGTCVFRELKALPIGCRLLCIMTFISNWDIHLQYTTPTHVTPYHALTNECCNY